MSILDQSPIDTDETVRDGIARTVELAQLADTENYTRYFVAEHHNIQEVVGTSPEILVTHLLNQTSRIMLKYSFLLVKLPRSETSLLFTFYIP